MVGTVFIQYETEHILEGLSIAELGTEGSTSLIL